MTLAAHIAYAATVLAAGGLGYALGLRRMAVRWKRSIRFQKAFVPARGTRMRRVKVRRQ